MAGDWVQMRIDLPDDPDVIGIADMTGLDPDTVCGKLLRFWGWASRHSADGYASVTLAYVSSLVGVAKFAEAMVAVGWLEAPAGAAKARIRIPKWERHLSKSAKQRALTKVRVSAHRKRTCNDCRVKEALPEKRREEKSKYPPNPPRGGRRGKETLAEEVARLRAEGRLPHAGHLG